MTREPRHPPRRRSGSAAEFYAWSSSPWDESRHSARAAETLTVIDEQTRRLAEQGPTQEELDQAKTFLKGSYALAFDTSTKIAGQILQIQLDKLGIDYPERRNALIDAVTLADAKRVAKRMLEAKQLTVVVGRAQGWSYRKTAAITALCGVGHVASSVVLGVLGIGLGIALGHLEWVEATRGSFAAWFLIVFGLAYAGWSLARSRRGQRNVHVHDGGLVHAHGESPAPREELLYG